MPGDENECIRDSLQLIHAWANVQGKVVRKGGFVVCLAHPVLIILCPSRSPGIVGTSAGWPHHAYDDGPKDQHPDSFSPSRIPLHSLQSIDGSSGLPGTLVSAAAPADRGVYLPGGPFPGPLMRRPWARGPARWLHPGPSHPVPLPAPKRRPGARPPWALPGGRGRLLLRARTPWWPGGRRHRPPAAQPQAAACASWPH